MRDRASRKRTRALVEGSVLTFESKIGNCIHVIPFVLKIMMKIVEYGRGIKLIWLF